jgi:hypothetical protein
MESKSKRNYERALYASEKNGIERGGSVESADRLRMAARGRRRGVDEDHIGQHHREAADTRLKGRARFALLFRLTRSGGGITMGLPARGDLVLRFRPEVAGVMALV